MLYSRSYSIISKRKTFCVGGIESAVGDQVSSNVSYLISPSSTCGSPRRLFFFYMHSNSVHIENFIGSLLSYVITLLSFHCRYPHEMSLSYIRLTDHTKSFMLNPDHFFFFCKHHTRPRYSESDKRIYECIGIFAKAI